MFEGAIDWHLSVIPFVCWNTRVPDLGGSHTRNQWRKKVSNVETVQAIYQAFGRGDVATILDRLDDAVEWETTVPVSDVPWLQARRGKANIVGFFKSLAPLKITRFEPHTIFDGGDKVFARRWLRARRSRPVPRPERRRPERRVRARAMAPREGRSEAGGAGGSRSCRYG